MNDTIAAAATPLVPSAIGILRLSGPGAVEAVDREIGRASCRERVLRLV